MPFHGPVVQAPPPHSQPPTLPNQNFCVLTILDNAETVKISTVVNNIVHSELQDGLH